jgi:release factor glutamine methyltransferase
MADPAQGRTLGQLIRQGERLLQGRSIDSPSLSVQLLCAHALGTSRLSVLIERDRRLPDDQWNAIWGLVSRRAAGEPVAYITGKKEFFGLDYLVGPGVLVPRPETEHLVELVETCMPKDKAFTFADLGTGSGILAIATALHRPMSRGVGVDLSLDALRIAQANARRHGVLSRVSFVRGDFCSVLGTGSVDLLLANPPYLSSDELARVDKEVSGYEPHAALCAGPTGFECIQAIALQSPRVLRRGGLLAMEIGSRQGADALAVLEEGRQFADIECRVDLAGRDRVITARRR